MQVIIAIGIVLLLVVINFTIGGIVWIKNFVDDQKIKVIKKENS